MALMNFILFLASLAVLIKCADYSIKYSSKLARALHFNEFIVSFFIIALISVLPEAIISIMSALDGNPELGLGTLFGSNIADLTLVFGIVALISAGGINIKSKILKNDFYYLILLLFPVILGFDGKLSRVDGLILVFLGVIFYTKIYMDSHVFSKEFKEFKREPFVKSLIFLVISLGVLLLAASLTVKFAVNFANDAKVPTVIIGLTIIALGTCLPELIFSIKAAKKDHDDLVLGDILGTVITDITIVLGLVALMSPFTYNPYNMYITGVAMFLSGILVIKFMRSEKTISKKEGIFLIIFYILFVFVEFFINNILSL